METDACDPAVPIQAKYAAQVRIVALLAHIDAGAPVPGLIGDSKDLLEDWVFQRCRLNGHAMY